MSNQLYSLELEKHLLGGLIQNPDVFSEIESHISDLSFASLVHGTIYNCIKSSILNNEKIDKILIGQKVKNLGVSFPDDINIFDYINAISFTPITFISTIGAAKEVAKLEALRRVDETCGKIKSHIVKHTNQQLEETISQIDALYGEQINSFDTNSGPEDIFENMLQEVEERGNNPVEEVGLSTPFPEFNRLYGGFRDGNLYVIISRAKAGKTTVLNHLAIEMSKFHKIPVLILDTEMSTKEIKFRMAANMSEVPLWYIETGNWRKNEKFIEKIRKSLSKENLSKNLIHHYSIRDKSIEQVSAIIRRWYLKVVGRGNKCMVIYDYLKIVDEKMGHNVAEHQIMGAKVNKLKKIAEELQLPVITAGQSNRDGIMTNKHSDELVDDASTIGISDRISWYSTYVGILRRKTADEFHLDTPESGTHKLIEIVARYQGKDASGHQDMLLRKFPSGKTKYTMNYINLDIQNFKVTEKGSLKDSINRQNACFKVEDPKNKDEEKDTI